MICATTRVLDLKIERRGRSAVPITRARTRVCRRSLCCVLVSAIYLCIMPSRPPSCPASRARLRLRNECLCPCTAPASWSHGSSRQTDRRLLVDARDRNDVLLNESRESFRDLEQDRVRKAHGELECFAGELSAVADTLHVETLAKRCVTPVTMLRTCAA